MNRSVPFAVADVVDCPLKNQRHFHSVLPPLPLYLLQVPHNLNVFNGTMIIYVN